ncbi:MAG: alpha/beta hydrolase [Pirellulales bacterium]
MLRIQRSVTAVACLFFLAAVGISAEPKLLTDIAYKPDASTEYERERCKLDLALPSNTERFATLIWFHGGGLENGDKADSIASGVVARFTSEGIAVASVNYRLSPKVHYPAYVEDAAAACAFVRNHISEYGGDAGRVFVSGHSAGGYLSAHGGCRRSAHRSWIVSQTLRRLLPISGSDVYALHDSQERGIDKDQTAHRRRRTVVPRVVRRTADHLLRRR